MKQYIVHQSCRCCYNKVDRASTKIQSYKFSPDIQVGTYTEKDFTNLVGEEFFKSGFFAKFCKLGWISVVETKDVTDKVASKSLDIL